MVTAKAPGGAVQMPNSCISGGGRWRASSAVKAQLNGTSSGSRKPSRDVAIKRIRVHAVLVDEAGDVVDAHVLCVGRDGRCAPTWTGSRGAAPTAAGQQRRPQPARVAAGPACASSISLVRSKARTDASPASARAQVSTSSACAAQQGRIGEQVLGALASRIQAGHHILPLMLMVISVGMTRDASLARRARHLHQLRHLAAAAPSSASGRKSSVSRKRRTT